MVDAQPALAWLLIVPPGGIYLANWAYTTQRRRHEGLEFLYTSTKLLHESSELESGIVELLRHVRETFHSEAAELIYLPEASDSPLCVRVGPGALVESFDVLDDGHHLLIELLETRQAAILSSSSPVPGTDFLRRRGYDDALIAPLVGERRVVGGLVIANHMSEIMRFDANDTRLAQTLANHAAVALENGRLEQSLQQLRVLESRLTFQATHDPLTDLANRTLFRTHLTNALEDHGGLQGAVLFVDLDDFKTVNDSFGHASGDALLIEVGIRLKNCVRPSDTVARLGGDEFAVLLADVTQSVQANAAARRILDALEEPVSLRDRCIQIRASVGIAMIDTTTDPSVLMRNADTAMYTAKAQGKGRFVTFETAMHESTLHRFNLRTDLEKALRNNELVVHYQPIVDLGSNELVGAEALVRWDHPALGLVPPARFLGVATESGLVAAIDMVVLDVACAWLARTDGLDPGCVPWVAVNMSPLSFREAGLVDRIRETLTANRLAPSRLRVEITEDLLADDVDGAIEILHQLQDVGVGLALDDFGTGYSSLSHLRMLPVDAIKIAKPFVDDLDSSLEQQAFVTAIITLGRNLRKFSIAEGIERPEQLDVLRAIGCDAGQGFLFARPMDEDGFTTWLHLSAKRNRAPGPSSAGVAPRTFAAVGGDRTGGG